MRARSFVSIGLVALVGSACAAPSSTGAPRTSAPASSAPAATVAATQAPTEAAPARIEGVFDIGDGQSLYIRCIGSGTPTILMEAGDTDTGVDHWRNQAGKLSEATRTCVYDRAGLGRSSPATGCRHLDDILDDLDALLAAAKVDGPYVLVGASGGGFLMAGFAKRHPEQVEGMVFVETPKALTAKLYPEILPEIACDSPTNVEHRAYVEVEHEVWDHRAKLGDFPISVISNDYGAAGGRDDATNVEDQQGWFVLSPDNSHQVVITSGHNAASNEPELVLNEILDVLAAARATGG